MKVIKVDITNFRGIKDLSIELDPRISVFIGENGTGKTAVLDAIATLLSSDSVSKMTESDITVGESHSSISLSCKEGDKVAERESRVNRHDAEGIYENGYVQSVPDIVNFMEWFYETEHGEGGEDKLENVIYVLKEFLPEFSDFTVLCDPLRMIVTKNGEELDLCQLSGGEIAIIDMVGVLAMRMVINYPKPGNALSGAGVVIIDEIDMHLHPVWQRMIVPKLLEIFPYCQFIISTNSPHVVNHVRPESVFILEKIDDGINVKKTNETYGKNVDMVLRYIMGMDTTRPDDVHADLAMLFKTIDAGKLDDARDQIVRLMDKIGIDPELVKAGVLIKRKEIIDK